jgi:hypothetical protein
MVLRGRSEELQRDVVGITEGQPRTITSIDDAAVRNPEFFQPEFPRFKLAPTAAVKGQMVQTNSTLIERTAVSGARKLMKSDESVAANEPDGPSKWARTLVK